MKKILLMLLVLLPVSLSAGNKKASKKADADTDNWRYEIESVTVGQTGTVVVKVWNFSKKPDVAMEQAKKNAVHGVIFKGIPNRDRVPGKKPLVSNVNAQNEHADFFNKFFANGGDYMRFVTLTNGGAIGAGDIMKTTKKEYKVGVVVTVDYSNLRKFLEDNGVISKLGGGIF